MSDDDEVWIREGTVLWLLTIGCIGLSILHFLFA
jgi:hypothetical protein